MPASGPLDRASVAGNLCLRDGTAYPHAIILRNRWEHCNVDFGPPSVSDETLSHRCLECVFELCALLHRNASQYPRLVRGSVARLGEPRDCEARDQCPRRS